MKTKSALWAIALLFVVACGLPGLRPPASSITPSPVPTRQPPPLPTVTPACVGDEPTQVDIDRALEFTGDLLESTEWERSYTVMDKRVGVTWYNNPIGAVIYLEALIYPCGYEDQDVDAYFTAENWDVIFSNYDTYEVTNQCRTGNGLRLYEIRATSGGADYNVRYWANNDTNNRVITVMMTFPAGWETEADLYAFRLFPPLTNCN